MAHSLSRKVDARLLHGPQGQPLFNKALSRSVPLLPRQIDTELRPSISTTTSTPLRNPRPERRTLMTLSLSTTMTLSPTKLRHDELVGRANADEPELQLGSPTSTRSLTSILPRPIPNSYWATPLLLACEYPWAPSTSSPKLDKLLAAGVRTFIDLTESGELKSYAGIILRERAEQLGIDYAEIRYHNFPIADRCLPKSVAYVHQILDVLRQNELEGRISAVHCRGGIGRTGTVVGCWLIQCGLSGNGDEALARIAKEWRTVAKYKRYPHSPETGAQVDFVKNFHRARSLRSRENTAR